VAQAHLDRIAAVDGAVHAFLHVDAEGALAQAARVDAGELTGPLAGVPLALKDVIVTQGVPTTVGSRILEGWRPPYDSTVNTRLRAAGVVVLGKTNMDEFAMGSSTEHSAYGPTHNPWDLTRTRRQRRRLGGGGRRLRGAARRRHRHRRLDPPAASVTGTVGVKPTYGGVSRYGLVAFSSSLDQAGPCARTVLDAALLHEAIAGHDPADSTSIDAPVPPVVEAARRRSVAGLRVAVVEELTGEGYEPGVQARFDEAVELLASLGATVTTVRCPHFAYALPAYYLIAPSEASSNLARFDSVRYGLRVGDDGVASLEEVMSATRAAGFGPEVKRRIVLGTYALSSGYYDAYYGQAQKVRTLITRDFAAAFEQADVLVSPASPGVAFPLGAKLDDPLAMYRQDLATIPSNLYGGPAMSLPVGLSEGLPVGLQVMAPTMRDELLYQVGGTLEAALLDRWGGPLLASAPELAVAGG
jgi:aspartyl-tRNA(Asn)/glutamyl-tRNA(Gln) amidotransferase subunit A